MNIDWLMGFIEAKGCFTISHQTIPKIKKYTQKYINNLKKEASIAEIQYLSKDGRIFTKDFLDYPLDIVNFLKNLITTYSFSRDYLIKRDLETLKETLSLISTIRNTIITYDTYIRPNFSLTFHKEDKKLAEQLKVYFIKQGIKVYGPYKINKGANLRIEVKGSENCIKFKEFLEKQNWNTNKKIDFEKWGKEILEIVRNEQ